MLSLILFLYIILTTTYQYGYTMKVPWTSGFHFYAYFGMRYSDPLDNPQLAQSNDDQRKLDFDPAKSNQGETVNR